MSKLSLLAVRLDSDAAHWCGDAKATNAVQEAAAALREAEQILRDIVAQKTYITRKNMQRIRALIGEKP